MIRRSFLLIFAFLGPNSLYSLTHELFTQASHHLNNIESISHILLNMSIFRTEEIAGRPRNRTGTKKWNHRSCFSGTATGSRPFCGNCKVNGTYFTGQPRSRMILGSTKGWFPKGWFWRMCSPGTKTGTRAHSDVPPERKPGTRVRSHVPPERQPERGHVRQNHPFTKPPFYLPVNCKVNGTYFTGQPRSRMTFLVNVESILSCVSSIDSEIS